MRSTPPSAGVSIWTRAYLFLGLVAFTCYLSQKALLPLIPLYIQELGGSEIVVGMVLAGFSLSSFTVRPHIGRIVDNWDPGHVLALGSLLLGAASLGMLIPVIAVLAAANVVRGVAWAAINTGANTILARLSPMERRGEAAGYYNLFPAIAGTIGPPLSLFMLDYFQSFSKVLVLAFGLGIVGSLLARPVSGARTVPPDGWRVVVRKGGHEGLIARGAMLPSTILILSTLSQAAVLGFAPLYGKELDLSSGILTAFYAINGVAAMLGRFFLGRVADRSGRGFAILGGTALKTLALIGLVFGSVVPLFLMASAFYALGHALIYPALTALAIDRADKKRMGASMATYSAAFQVGNGAGAMLTGMLLAVMGYPQMYTVMTVVLASTFAVVVWRWPELRNQGVA